jgi:surface polysaccharide O-acyltransferase-like enzyme
MERLSNRETPVVASKGGTVTSYHVIRAAATLLIIMSHVITCWYSDGTYGETYYQAGTVRMAADSVIFVVLTRWCLPSFFMMSGALLLTPQKDIPLGKVKKYVVRMLEVLGVFGYCFCLIELVIGGKSFHFVYLWQALLNLVQGNCWGHMWYLYTLIGLYLIMPFLRKFIEAYSEKAVVTATAIAGVLFVVIPTVNKLTGLTITSFDLTAYKAGIFYFLCGYVLVHTQWSDRLSKPLVGGLMLLAAVITAVLQVKSYWVHDTYKDPHYVWTAVLACGFFWWIVRSPLMARLGENRIIVFFSKHSFAIYLIHMVFINLLYKGLHIFPNVLPPVIGELVIWVGVTVLATAASVVMHKIPWLKKLI